MATGTLPLKHHGSSRTYDMVYADGYTRFPGRVFTAPYYVSDGNSTPVCVTFMDPSTCMCESPASVNERRCVTWILVSPWREAPPRRCQELPLGNLQSRQKNALRHLWFARSMPSIRLSTFLNRKGSCAFIVHQFLNPSCSATSRSMLGKCSIGGGR